MSPLPSPPAPGEPLRASWARQLLDAIRSLRITAGPGLVSHQTPAGTTIALAKAIQPAAKPSRPRPFACRIGKDTAEGAEDGAMALFCYLPPETAQAVRFRGEIVMAKQNLGTTGEPWVRLGAAGEFAELYLVISFEEQSPETDGGEPVVAATGWTLSTDNTSGPLRWPHLVWANEGDVGAVQYHLGSLSLGNPGAAPSEEGDEDENDCSAADTEAFPSRIDEIDGNGGGGGGGDSADDSAFPSAGGASGVSGSEQDDAAFPSKVDVCW